MSSYTQSLQMKRNITQFLKTNSTFQQFTNQFFLPKKHDYNESIIDFYSRTYGFYHKKFQVENQQGQRLYTSVFTKQKLSNSKIPENCIIYTHGFGSTRLQGVQVLKVLKDNFALCCFDFSGSGKSQGQIITYGAKEKQDIHYIIKFLKSKGFKKFVLWGRSMGATSCLLHSLKYQQEEVFLQIIDSAFYSFQKIALQLVSKFTIIPQFGTNFLLDAIKKNCQILQNYNPFTVTLEKVKLCKTPTIFIYSETDQIVSSSNSEQICRNYQAFFQKILITQKHNVPRSMQTLSQIMKKIQIQLNKYNKLLSNNNCFKSFIDNKNVKKGIQRSIQKQQMKINTSTRESMNSICSDYGVSLVSKKTKAPNQITKFHHSPYHSHQNKLGKNTFHLSPFRKIENQDNYHIKKFSIFMNKNNPNNYDTGLILNNYQPNNSKRQDTQRQNSIRAPSYSSGKRSFSHKKLNVSLSKLKQDYQMINLNKKQPPKTSVYLSTYFDQDQLNNVKLKPQNLRCSLDTKMYNYLQSHKQQPVISNSNQLKWKNKLTYSMDTQNLKQNIKNNIRSSQIIKFNGHNF